MPFFLRQRYLTQGTIRLEGREDPGGKGANLVRESGRRLELGPGGREASVLSGTVRATPLCLP